MTITDVARKTPFPWFGGKRDAAPAVWAALGDVHHYVEPFAGGLAVLLHRPHPANRTYYSETVGDADGLLINFWRSVQLSPDATADAASWPVTEADKHARSCAVLATARRLDMERLMGDPTWHDPQLAGWWVWCVCVSIGAFGAGGPWWPDETGRLRKYGRDEPRPDPGVSRNLPDLTGNGRGVNHPGTREPGVSRGLPHLGDNGRGVNHPGTREPGVTWHPMTMPALTEWFGYLQARLRHVRILNGDWKRAVGTGAALTLPVRQGKSPAGVFLDPPYNTGGDNVYNLADGDSARIAADVAQWAVATGTDPRWRIVAAGYADDPAHTTYLDAGWTEIDWHTDGYLTGGYGNQSHRERLYLSPHCLTEPTDGLW